MNSTNPFERGKVANFLWPDWVGYSFGTIFIILGLVILTFIPRAKRNASIYRKRQLEEYNKQNKSQITDYKKTKMFLPPWERTKYFAPTFFGVLFIFVGIAFMVGNSLTVL